MMNNKGLIKSLAAIMIALFLVAFVAVVTIPIGDTWDAAIQNLPENVADNYTKQQIADHTGFVHWQDKVFVVILVVLLIAYIVTSFTLPVQSAWIFLLFTGVLVLLTFAAMILSNSWTYMLSDPFLKTAQSSLTVTDYVMRNFPYFVFLLGVTGGVIFYSRSREESPGFEGPGIGGLQ